MSDADIALKDALLEAVLPDVLFDGWADNVLTRHSRALGVAPEKLATLYPGGARDLAFWIDDWADRRMVAAMAARDLTGMRSRDKVAAAVKARLDALLPHREAVRRAIALKAMPLAATALPGILYRTVDEIWYLAGDRSTDFNFYTKRALLAGVYAGTVLHWLEDDTEGQSASWAFLDRRIAEVLNLPKLGGKLRSASRHFTGPFHYVKHKLRARA